jgi:hypothetical protein
VSAEERLGGARVVHPDGHNLHALAFFADGPLAGRVIDTWLRDVYVAADGTIYHLYRVERPRGSAMLYYRVAGSVWDQ